jgi:phosphatidylinositol glycan class Q protein
MGVPAGFKLNTQLAEALGLVSLNMIQVWSTLLYFLKPVFGPSLHVFVISGMLLGITVPAAMIADMLFLVTFHISALHQFVAFLYSNQLQALAALWRLFRLTAYLFVHKPWILRP